MNKSLNSPSLCASVFMVIVHGFKVKNASDVRRHLPSTLILYDPTLKISQSRRVVHSLYISPLDKNTILTQRLQEFQTEGRS